MKNDWQEHWHGMPEYVPVDLRPFDSSPLWLTDRTKVIVHFRNAEDRRQFKMSVGSKTFSRSELEAFIGGKCANGMCPSIWYPLMPDESYADREWVREGEPLNPRWPVYIISKG